MEKFKGTPGPWEHEDGDVWSGDELVTVITDEFQPKDIHLHNANLIAAAPDLLEALQSIVTTDAEVLKILTPKQREAANSAIARALSKNDGGLY